MASIAIPLIDDTVFGEQEWTANELIPDLVVVVARIRINESMSIVVIRFPS